jgi:branched-chain amino acid transport system permease protein
MVSANLGLAPIFIVLLGTMAAIPVCMTVGYGLERLAYRPLRNAPKLAPLITAIGMSIILQQLAMVIWSRNNLAFPQIIPTYTVEIAGATITGVQMAIITMSVVLMLVLSLIVYRTRLGIAMRATAENPHVAQLMGVATNRVIASTFIIGQWPASCSGRITVSLTTPWGPCSASRRFPLPSLAVLVTWPERW